MAYEKSPVFISALVFLIGVWGGKIAKKISSKENPQKSIVASLVNLAIILLVNIFVFIICIPLFLLLVHSSLSALLLFLGIITPFLWYVPNADGK